MKIKWYHSLAATLGFIWIASALPTAQAVAAGVTAFILGIVTVVLIAIEADL